MIFRTETNSRYEIDLVTRKMRRLVGFNEPTANQGADGEWKSYERISEIKLGSPVVIVWSVGEEIIRRTITSTVIHIEGGK